VPTAASKENNLCYARNGKRSDDFSTSMLSPVQLRFLRGAPGEPSDLIDGQVRYGFPVRRPVHGRKLRWMSDVYVRLRGHMHIRSRIPIYIYIYIYMPRPYVAASLCACTMRLRAYATARRKTPPWHRSQYLYGGLASVSLDRRVPSKATSSYLSCKRPSISTEFRPSIYKCLTWKLGRLNLRGRSRSREESYGSSDVQAI